MDDTVKAVTVDGVEATVEAVKDGSYPVSRPFLAMYDETVVDDATLAFLDFLMSTDGQAIVEEHGGISIN